MFWHAHLAIEKLVSFFQLQFAALTTAIKRFYSEENQSAVQLYKVCRVVSGNTPSHVVYWSSVVARHRCYAFPRRFLSPRHNTCHKSAIQVTSLVHHSQRNIFGNTSSTTAIQNLIVLHFYIVGYF